MTAYVFINNATGEADGVVVADSPMDDVIERFRAIYYPGCKVSVTTSYDIVNDHADLLDLYPDLAKPEAGSRVVRVQLSQLLRETATVELTVPEGATVGEILQEANRRYEKDGESLRWEIDPHWCDEGTPVILGPKS